jgi:hypothetical protein
MIPPAIHTTRPLYNALASITTMLALTAGCFAVVTLCVALPLYLVGLFAFAIVAALH